MHCSKTSCKLTSKYASATTVGTFQAKKGQQRARLRREAGCYQDGSFFFQARQTGLFKPYFSVCHCVYQVAVKATSEPFSQSSSEISYQILIGLGSCTQAFV